MVRRLAASRILTATTALLLAALARADEFGGSDVPSKLMNAQTAAEQRSAARRPGVASHISDTTFVGYNPAYATSNYWSIGVGHNYPLAGGDDSRRGYWDYDELVNGDSLQGWWPVRRRYTSTGSLTIADNLRPWWAVDIGNQTNYVGKSGPAGDYGQKRTIGVIGGWHSDPGNTITSSISGTTPVAPTWTPLGGSRSAWCGLRSHGDLTAIDPITKNYYNQSVAEQHQFNDLGASGTDFRFPGYLGQWDQMLYRDVSIPSSGTIQVRFKYRSNMSTTVNTNNITRTGWFDKDPLAITNGNYIKSSANANAPIDSFMVYLGRPVETVDGDDNDWTGSDALGHDVYDPLRRWFAEVVHAFDATHHELFTTTGNHAVTTQTVSYNAATLESQGYGGTARLVFRIKTNRGSGSDDESGSIAGNYNSGGAGAAIVDDIELDTGSGFVSIGTFETPSTPADSATTIDNDPAYAASERWKTTGKPPATYFHAHDIADLVYNDLCGPVDSPTRRCNMTGVVVSWGDHDQSENMAGLSGTTEQETTEAMESPTINLKTDGIIGSTVANDMGLTFDMVNVSEDIYVWYELYTGVFDLFTYGQIWQPGFASYPASQANGVKCWGNVRYPGFNYFNADVQCVQLQDGGYANGMIRTSNAGGRPDSIRIAVRKIGQCFRFGISTQCGPALGAYVDNTSVMFVDGASQPLMSVDIWQMFQDTFPANEDAGLLTGSAFDTCGAYVRTGLNIAQSTGNLNRIDIAGDTSAVTAGGGNVAVHLVFRINPGPGNYVTLGDKSSGLRKVPQAAAAIASGDGSFWATYIADNGDAAYPNAGGANQHGSSGAFETRWNALAWNAARMDTTEVFAFPLASRAFNVTPLFGSYATMYHESDPHGGHLAPLALTRNICFVNDVAGPLSDITCGRSNEPAWPPAWVTTQLAGANTAGIPPSKQSDECTKIFPDGLFTPGTHVQYFFRREDGTNPVNLVPDTSLVYPQPTEASTDAHRWQQFSVLPDNWKSVAYGGGALACMLYVDWNDSRGNERVWVSIADSIGATAQEKWGAHNGWHAAGDQDVNDPAARVFLNEQPGTSWDMYGVKASESLNTSSGSLGARSAHRESSPAARAYRKDARNAPTIDMLERYYRIMLLTTGDLNSQIFGPFSDKSADDKGIIEDWLIGANIGAHRGIWISGDGFTESLAGDPWLNNFGVAYNLHSYLLYSGNNAACIDLFTQAPITTNGDIYGVMNSCLFTNDVPIPVSGGVEAAEYDNTNGATQPYVASVFRDAVAPNYWQALVDAYDLEHLRSRLGDNSIGRLAYFYNVFTNIFSKICAIEGAPSVVLDSPATGDARPFVDAVSLRNNPLRTGDLTIALSFAKSDRATVRIFDVSGRVIRTLANRQSFRPGEHVLRWDGADDSGRRVARGVYFARTVYETRGFESSRKAVVVK